MFRYRVSIFSRSRELGTTAGATPGDDPNLDMFCSVKKPRQRIRCFQISSTEMSSLYARAPAVGDRYSRNLARGGRGCR